MTSPKRAGVVQLHNNCVTIVTKAAIKVLLFGEAAYLVHTQWKAVSAYNSSMWHFHLLPLCIFLSILYPYSPQQLYCEPTLHQRLQMESGLKVLTPTEVPKPKNPWGAPKVLAHCSLASVMDEELARRLSQEESDKAVPRYA